MSREEELARKLIAFYGLTVLTGDFTFPFRIKVRNDKTDQSLLFPSWDDILFRKETPEHMILSLSLNDFLSSSNSMLFSGKCSNTVIEYSSLDELDIQLTLMGMNG